MMMKTMLTPAPAWVLLECGQRQFHTDESSTQFHTDESSTQFHTDDINLPLTLHLDLWRKAEKNQEQKSFTSRQKKKKNKVADSACNAKVKTPNAVKVGGQW